MNEFLNEFLPNILAGLFPSLLALIPTFVLIFKNINVNKIVDELGSKVHNVLKGEQSFESIIKESIKEFKDLNDGSLKELKELVSEMKEAARNDIQALEESFNQRMKDQEHLYQNQIQRLKAKGVDPNVEDVSLLW